MTDSKRQILSLVTIGVVLIAGALLYLLFAQSRAQNDLLDRQERAQARVNEFELESRPSTSPTPPNRDTETGSPLESPVEPGEVVVVHRVPGEDYTRLAVRHHDGSRTLLDMRCLRVHIAAGNGMCLADESNPVPDFEQIFFRADRDGFPVTRSYPIAFPSRARISPSGTTASSTGFVEGVSYEDIVGKSVTVTLIDSVSRGQPPTVLNQFSIDGETSDVAGVQKFWGVTFLDDEEFWVTGLRGDAAELFTGRRSTRSLASTGLTGSCPSLSPDGNSLAYKRTSSGPNGFELVVRDLTTGEETVLDETRSFDDQVEWLDNDTLLYALHPDDADPSTVGNVQPQFDIWSLDTTPGAEPELFLPSADSPAVIR